MKEDQTLLDLLEMVRSLEPNGVKVSRCQLSTNAEVFEQPIGHGVVPIAAVQNLFAMEIDGGGSEFGPSKPRSAESCG